MNNDILIAIEINCETGEETVRSLTPEEEAHREAHRMHDEQRRMLKDTKDATEDAERLALATWIAGQSTLPEAARNALARATGVSLPGTLPPGGVT